MTNDILKEASRALHATTEEADPSARFTRARVLASLHQQKRRKATKTVVLIPLAAILLGGSALAATGGKVPRVVYQMAEAIGIAPPATQQADLPVGIGGRAAPQPLNPTVLDPSVVEGDPEPEEPEEEAEPEPEVVEVPEEPPPKAVTVAPSGSTGPASKPTPQIAEPAPPQDAEGTKGYELYRAAHRQHFEERNAATALQAWNKYLREAPGGRFALEANYNRGICLVRLGRASEAQRVLEPFADGLYGGYRQAEAKQLVDALKGEQADAGAR